MSSRFTVGRDRTGAARPGGAGRADLDVVVGGLGLGYTALAALENAGVRSLIVVDALAEVIEWHEQGLLPLGKQLTGDPRCRLVNGDFFAMAGSAEGFDAEQPGRRFDAVLVDIDHSPRNLLHPRHAALYEPEGLARLAEHLQSRRRVRAVVERSTGCGVQRALADVFATSDSACRDLRQLRSGITTPATPSTSAVKAALACRLT